MNKDQFKQYCRERIAIGVILRRLGWLKIENFDKVPIGIAFSVFRNEHFTSRGFSYRKCKCCGKDFIVKIPWQYCCSPKCNRSVYRKMKVVRDKLNAYKREWRKRLEVKAKEKAYHKEYYRKKKMEKVGNG